MDSDETKSLSATSSEQKSPNATTAQVDLADASRVHPEISSKSGLLSPSDKSTFAPLNPLAVPRTISPPARGSMGPPALPASRMKQQRKRKSMSVQPPGVDETSTTEASELITSPVIDSVSESSEQEDQNLIAQHTASPPVSSSPVEIENELTDFDWHDFQVRYHEKMAELSAQEHALSKEYGALCDVRHS